MHSHQLHQSGSAPGSRQAVLVWDFIVKDDLQPVSTVKAVLPVEDDDSYPTLQWLDITQTNCNCNKYPTCGLIVQNNSNESQFLYDDGDHSDDSEIIMNMLSMMVQ
jgi:hypothetical protein